MIEFSNSSIDASSGEVVLNAGTSGYEYENRKTKQGDSLNVSCYSNLPVLWVVVQGEETIVSKQIFIVPLTVCLFEVLGRFQLFLVISHQPVHLTVLGNYSVITNFSASDQLLIPQDFLIQQ